MKFLIPKSFFTASSRDANTVDGFGEFHRNAATNTEAKRPAQNKPRCVLTSRISPALALCRILSIAALTLGATASAASAMSTPKPAAVIVLEPYVDQAHYVFHGRINGEDGRFQIDTGGGLSVFSPQAAAMAGCKPWGQVTGFRMRGDRLDLKRCDHVAVEIGGVRFGFPIVGIWDLNGSLPKDAPPLSGSIGLDAFAGRAVTLDLAGRKLIVETPATLKARISHATEIPIHVVSETEGYSKTIAAGLDTPLGRIWLDVDSGNDTSITVGRHVAALLGLDPQKKGAQAFSTILPGGVPLQGSAYVQDLIYDGNIGSPILRHRIVTFDMANGRMWIAPNAP
jgi:hypothetical protein